ncbi:hypothetical protein EXIGLDRAFT_726987 [Exidia glandulosa HHB12029]|uniref:Uncharacterized protein n=1 Tax=Exidia glandulosa HHB12029 TaxID=1314781 RepID=A0A165DI36_EXIGL|nr:hypothetical protein EXIGLDRAFT_726987 [Exidia glandulosa HHB12029]
MDAERSRTLSNSTRTRTSDCIRSRATLAQQEQEPVQSVRKPSATRRRRPDRNRTRRCPGAKNKSRG